jgi:hypothetical protein
LFGCEKENNVFNVDYTPHPFSGITHTNAVGAINGPVDTDDWRLNAEAKRVFENLWLSESPDTNSIYPAFPNPVSESFGLRFYLSKQSEWSFILIDNDRNILKSATGESDAGLKTIWWSTAGDTGGALAPGIYRVMYRIGDRVGYGDIEIVE